MKRVLHILPGLQPNDGISTVFMNYLQHIDHSRFQFDVICHWPFSPDYRDLVESFGGSVTYLPRITLKNIRSTSEAINHFFNDHSPYDIVHCHMANAAFLYLAVAKKNCVGLRIVHSHQDHYADSLSHAIRNFPLVTVGKKYANCRIACSIDSGNFLFNNNNFFVLHNSIDTNKFAFSEEKRSNFRNKMGFGSRQLVFGSIGRLTAQKNQSFVLDIFQNLLKIYSESILIIIGEGDLKAELVKKADLLGISKSIRWMDNIVDMDYAYQGLDALLFPSLYEGLPLTLVEAQASGLPCFVSDRISKEAFVTDHAFPLPIDKGIGVWEDSVQLKLKENTNSFEDRSRYAHIVAEAGFDIHQTADDLTKIYDLRLIPESRHSI